MRGSTVDEQSAEKTQDVLDRFAAAFLQGFIEHSGTDLGIPYGTERERMARMAYEYAEAMMMERNRRNCVGTVVPDEKWVVCNHCNKPVKEEDIQPPHGMCPHCGWAMLTGL